MYRKKNKSLLFITFLIILIIGLTVVSATETPNQDNILSEESANNINGLSADIENNFDQKINKNETIKSYDKNKKDGTNNKKATQLTSNIPESLSINEINESGVTIYGYTRGVIGTRYYEDDDIYQDEYENLYDETVHVIINNKNYTDLKIYELPEELNDDNSLFANPDSNSGYSFNFYPDKIGEYNISIIYDGNEKYESKRYDKTLKVINEKATLMYLLGKVTSNDTLRGNINNTTTYYIGDNIDLECILYHYVFATDSYYKIPSSNILLNYDGNNYSFTNINDCHFKYNLTLKNSGENIIKVFFDGGNNFQSQEIVKMFNVCKKVDININATSTEDYYFTTVKYGDNKTVEGLLLSDMKPMANCPIIIKSFNTEDQTVYTDNNGYFSFEITVYESYDYTLCFEGDENYENTSKILKVYMNQADVNLTINSIDNVTYDKNVTVSGRLTDLRGNGINEELIVLINDKIDGYVNTDDDGFYQYEFTAPSIGTNKVEIIHYNTDRYVDATIETKFNVTKKELIIRLVPMKDYDLYNNIIKVRGIVNNIEGKRLSNVKLKVSINNVYGYIKTDKNGIFEYKETGLQLYELNFIKSGANNVSISYDGNSRYSSKTMSSSFNFIAGTQEAIIRIATIKYNSIGFIVKGILNNKEGKRLSNTNLSIYLNKDYAYIIKTDKNGIFSYNYTMSKVKKGVNNVTVKFSGNTKYASTITTSTFNYTPGNQETIIRLVPLKDTNIKENIRIRGILNNLEGKRFKNTPITIKINNHTFDIKTDNNGIFDVFFDNSTITPGINNVTVIYNGNTKYAYNEISTTFNCSTEEKETIIRLVPIQNPYKNENIRIRGIINDKEGKRLKNVALSLMINNENKFNIYSDYNGIFDHYIPSSYADAGINNITVIFEGNDVYASTQTKTSVNYIKSQ